MIKILYLEDSEVDINLTRYELEKSFPLCTISIAHTVGEALAILKTNPGFDVAILDLNLPDGSGMDILMHIRKMHFPIATIILTSSGNEEAAIAALKAGADNYLTKNQGYYGKLAQNIKTAIDEFHENIKKISNPLKVLYVEWNKPDIDFTLRHMRKYAPYIHIDVVTSAEEFLDLIPENKPGKFPYDILLMDYRLPGLNALETIKIIRHERKLPISIVIVTGHGSEEVAVQALKMGANEYLVKRKNYLFRLPSLLTSAHQRQALEQQQAALAKSESKYRLLAENSKDVIFILDMDLNHVYVSPSVKQLRGFEVEEAMKQNLAQVLTPESFNKVQELIVSVSPLLNKNHYLEIEPRIFELEMIRKDGTTVWAEVNVSILANENNVPVGVQGAARDISQRRAASEALYESREEYRKFFEDDITGNFISHIDGYLIKGNPAYLQMLGFKSLEEAKNYDLKKVHVSSGQRAKMLEEIRKNKKVIGFEHDLVKTDGTIIHAIANIIGQFNRQGELETLKGYIIDDTLRRKATEELRKLSRAIEQSPASVIITDLEGNIEYTNPRFTEISGFSFEEIKGRNPRILKSGNVPDHVYSELWETITTGRTWSGELLNKRKDGSLFWESASISPVKNDIGQTTHYLAVKENITEKKKYEEDLIIARDKARESDRLKSAFLATMSHELRTPLNAIIGFSDLINEKMEINDIVHFTKIINNSGNHLLNIINDIFAISLLQTGQTKIVIEEFKLSDFFKTLTQYSNLELKNRNKTFLNLHFHLEEEQSRIIVSTDKTKISQVLINFIKNAIEYTEKGEIEVGYQIENQNILFFVKDTGIGIPKDKVDIIFERFRQVDDTHTRLHGGVGLGLSICTEIAKLLKAKIWVESEFGKGSTFFFLLNDVIVPVKTFKKDETLRFPDFSNKTILIVEDDKSNCLLLKTYLSKSNARIVWANSGEESIQMCKSNPDINLVLMDLRMPGMDGIEATRRIREFMPELVFVAQTAYALENDRKFAKEAHFDDYITKPIDQHTLIEVIKKYLV